MIALGGTNGQHNLAGFPGLQGEFFFSPASLTLVKGLVTVRMHLYSHPGHVRVVLDGMIRFCIGYRIIKRT